MKKALTTLVKVAVSGTIMFFLLRSVDTGKFWEMLRATSPAAIAASALIYTGLQCVTTYRWSVILGKDMTVPYPKLFSIYFIGMFFNNFLPTLVGGDVIKGYYLYKLTGRGGPALASIFMDRYSGFTALMFITFLALFPGYPLIKGTGLALFFALLLGGYVLVSLVLWTDRLHGRAMSVLARIRFYGINEKIDKFYRVLMSYRSERAILAKVFAFSLIVQGGVIIGYYVLARGMGMEVSLAHFFLYIPLTTAASMVPISLAGLGIREGVFVFLFTKAGASVEEALGLSLLWFAIMVAVSLIGGIEYIRLGAVKDVKLEN
ncbi:MAG TPA: flippase-like domain-containing protein [Deltaproteobacteria bacterium]|nr:flippase-like domain-containing protein [Deltaproteobacteria bacterium]